MLPLISIITPSYNQASYIEATIQSVLAQNYPHLEHLIIDGGSTDGTLKILQKYESVLQWVSEPDTGQANAINKGFKKSTGEIVAWLNSDDIYMPAALHRVAKFFNEHPHIDILYGDYHLIDQYGHVLLRKQEIPFDYNILLYGLDYISQPTTFFRRSVFERSGYLDESLHYGLDWEYWLRLANDGCQFAHLPYYLAATRWHTDAKTLVAPPEMYAEHEAIRARYWKKQKLSSVRLHRAYEVLLNKYYRAKRQFIKLIHRRTIDFPPGHWIMYNHK
ncbi:MAG: glycosyltransferase [Anaerolineae bacterium]|nr:glycosyltransferase [Anaerolineae bacterium]